MVYISNALSLNMLGANDCSVRNITIAEAKEIMIKLVPGSYIDWESERDGSDAVYALTAQSCVGHADIASVLSGLIGFDVPVNRVSVALKPGDVLVVGQYIGPRLPEGCKNLPDGAKIEWYIVRCLSNGTIDRLNGIAFDLRNAAANMEWPEEGKRILLDTARKYFPQYFEGNAFN